MEQAIGKPSGPLSREVKCQDCLGLHFLHSYSMRTLKLQSPLMLPLSVEVDKSEKVTLPLWVWQERPTLPSRPRRGPCDSLCEWQAKCREDISSLPTSRFHKVKYIHTQAATFKSRPATKAATKLLCPVLGRTSSSSTRGGQPFGVSASHWKKTCLGPRMKHIGTCNHRRTS